MNKVREIRLRQELSVRGLARKAGISPTLVSAIERGRQRPGIGAVVALSLALRTPAPDLFPDLFPSVSSEADNAKSA